MPGHPFWFSWRTRQRRPTPTSVGDDDLLAAIPPALRQALPSLDAAALFIAWSLATTGHSAAFLQRHLATLSHADAHLIVDHVRYPTGGRHPSRSGRG